MIIESCMKYCIDTENSLKDSKYCGEVKMQESNHSSM